MTSKIISGKRFEGKVVIVTASTQGIGFSIAERFGLEGASVVISSRKQVLFLSLFFFSSIFIAFSISFLFFIIWFLVFRDQDWFFFFLGLFWFLESWLLRPFLVSAAIGFEEVYRLWTRFHLKWFRRCWFFKSSKDMPNPVQLNDLNSSLWIGFSFVSQCTHHGLYFVVWSLNSYGMSWKWFY